MEWSWAALTAGRQSGRSTWRTKINGVTVGILVDENDYDHVWQAWAFCPQPRSGGGSDAENGREEGKATWFERCHEGKANAWSMQLNLTTGRNRVQKKHTAVSAQYVAST